MRWCASGYGGVSGRQAPPRCSERTQALPDRLVDQPLVVASARSSPAGSQVLLQGGDLTRPLSSSSRPRRSMLRVPQTRDTCASPSPLAQTRLPAGEGSDRIPILGFFPAAPRASSSEVLAESVQEIQGKNSTRHRVCTQPLHPSCHAGAGWDTKLSHPVPSPRPAPLLGRSELSRGRQQIRTIMLSC